MTLPGLRFYLCSGFRPLQQTERAESYLQQRRLKNHHHSIYPAAVTDKL